MVRDSSGQPEERNKDLLSDDWRTLLKSLEAAMDSSQIAN